MKLLSQSRLTGESAHAQKGRRRGSCVTQQARRQHLLEHVEMETPLARSEEGKISAGIAQGTGPQLAPNASM